MLLLAAALRLGLVPERAVRPAVELLIRHMALLFVPAGVGVMVYADLLAREWLPILRASAMGAVAVLLSMGGCSSGRKRMVEPVAAASLALAATVAVYAAGRVLQRRTGSVLLHPVLLHPG